MDFQFPAEFEPVIVQWQDTFLKSGWYSSDEISHIVADSRFLIKSVGWLVAETDDCVVLAMSWSERRLGELLVIPADNVVDVLRLNDEDRKRSGLRDATVNVTFEWEKRNADSVIDLELTPEQTQSIKDQIANFKAARNATPDATPSAATPPDNIGNSSDLTPEEMDDLFRGIEPGDPLSKAGLGIARPSPVTLTWNGIEIGNVPIKRTKNPDEPPYAILTADGWQAQSDVKAGDVIVVITERGVHADLIKAVHKNRLIDLAYQPNLPLPKISGYHIGMKEVNGVIGRYYLEGESVLNDPAQDARAMLPDDNNILDEYAPDSDQAMYAAQDEAARQSSDALNLWRERKRNNPEKKMIPCPNCQAPLNYNAGDLTVGVMPQWECESCLHSYDLTMRRIDDLPQWGDDIGTPRDGS